MPKQPTARVDDDVGNSGNSHQPLPRSFFDRDVALVARELLGKKLFRRTAEGLTVGRIVEAEAYRSRNDSACHAARGRTARNEVMFGPPGHAYVYSIHARYCLNAVTDAEGVASAVLVRAVEPIAGIDVMQRRRSSEKLLELARGPARLCEAFHIDRGLNGWDLTAGIELWITDDDEFDSERVLIGKSPRIGVTSAEDLQLRFFLDGSRFVSGPRRFHSTRTRGA